MHFELKILELQEHDKAKLQIVFQKASQRKIIECLNFKFKNHFLYTLAKPDFENPFQPIEDKKDNNKHPNK